MWKPDNIIKKTISDILWLIKFTECTCMLLEGGRCTVYVRVSPEDWIHMFETYFFSKYYSYCYDILREVSYISHVNWVYHDLLLVLAHLSIKCWVYPILCCTRVSLDQWQRFSKVFVIVYQSIKTERSLEYIWLITRIQFHNQSVTVSVNLIIADQILNGSLCCSKKYNWCLSL